MIATLVHNPTAGFGKPSKEEIIKTLNDKGYRIKYVSSKDDDIKAAFKDPGDLVIAAGGDGTIGKVSNLLIGRNIPIGILSLGTANNIATSLQACGLPQLEIDTWDLSNRFPFDIGKATGSWGETTFFESVGFGIFPKLIKESEERQKSAHLSFSNRKEKTDYALKILKEVISKISVASYQISLNGGGVITGEYLLVEVMNIRSIGPNIILVPDANPGDGYFDVVLISEAERESLIVHIESLIKGENTPYKSKRQRAKHIIIKTKDALLHIDDEVAESEKNQPVEITLESGKLMFI